MPRRSKSGEQSLEMSVLHQISKVIVFRKNVSQLIDEVVEILFKEMGLKRGTVTLKKGNLLVIEASHGLSDSARQRGVYRMGEGVTGRVAKTGKSMVIPDISKAKEFLNRTKSRTGEEHAAFVCVPIIYMDDVIGTMSIDRIVTPETDLRRDLALLETISNILADAVSSLYLYEAERDKLIAENRALRMKLDDKLRPKNIVGNCGRMREIFGMISIAADSDANVLISGEAGTGKDLAARAIASGGKYAGRPFAVLNCGALPEARAMAELFGAQRTLPNGHVQKARALIEEAEGGTLYLDGVGSISKPLQARLLNFLETKTFSRMGGNEKIPANVRIISSTGMNLEELVKDGSFSEDLFYKLNAIAIHLPALRDRKSDIMLLAEHFLEKYNRIHKKKVSRISTPAINMLTTYHYPGNVRELENSIERAVLLSAEGVISGYNLPPSLQTGQSTNTSRIPDGEDVVFESLVDAFEREVITEALKLNRGNCAAAARQLSLTERIMNYKIRKLGILPKNFKISGS